MAAPLLELRQINKFFGAAQVLKNFSMTVKAGEIIGLIGENGAGKSTAMNATYGLFKPDSGEIFWKGQKTVFLSPLDARTAGVGMVHQHFMLSLHQTLLENVLVSMKAKPWSWINPTKMADDLSEKALQLGFKPFSWTQKVSDLSVGEQQQLEIFKALLYHPDLLILDEPTAVLTPQEVAQLFETLKKFKDRGTAIVIITHKLKEIISVTDRVYVLRRGENITSVATNGASVEDLAAAMIGHKSVPSKFAESEIRAEKTLQISNLRWENKGPSLDIQSLFCLQGETIGLAGVEGNGQDLLIQALLEPTSLKNLTGQIQLAGQNILKFSTAEILKLGLRALPEDRLRFGILPQRSSLENFVLGHQQAFSSSGWMNWSEARAQAETSFKNFDVRPLDLQLSPENFSGGNQQKMVVAREILNSPKFLVAAHPTRGVDLKASDFIRQQIKNVTKTGSVLLISSDLDELFQMCDRIYVIYKGRIQKEFRKDQFQEKQLGAAMAGLTL